LFSFILASIKFPFSASWNINEAIQPIESCTISARAIALLESTDVDLIPNHIRVAKARMEPPANRKTQMVATSGVRLYKKKTNCGKNVQVPPKKIAKNMLIAKRWRNFIIIPICIPLITNVISQIYKLKMVKQILNVATQP
jgi:hypothetical protein